MPFIYVPSSLESLSELGLPSLYKDSSILFNKHARAILVRREYLEGREFYTEISLIVAGQKYSIERIEICRYRKAPIIYFRVTSKHSLSSHKTSQIKKHAKNALAILYKGQRENSFNIVLVDETKPIRPRSVAKLVSVLNEFSKSLDKVQYYSGLLDFLIPAFMSEEEASLLYKHIRKSGGRGVSKIATLVFELAYEKHHSCSTSPTTGHSPWIVGLMAWRNGFA
jgi:hypothetical protein